MEKKRLVWITPDYFFDTDKLIVGNLQDYYEIRWYVIWGKGSPYKEPDNKIIYKFLKTPYRNRDIRIVKFYISLMREIKEYNPDAIYNGVGGMPFFYPLLFSMFDKHKIIHEGHEIDPYNYVKHDVLRVNYVKYYMRRVGHTHVFSKYTEKQFHKLYPNQECTYIPMVPKDYGEGTNLIDNQGKKIFLFFGGVRKTKRLDILLDAFLALDKEYSNKAELWVYGKCPENEKQLYEEKIRNSKNIVMKLDFVPDDIVADLFFSSTYLVLPYEQITQSGPMMISYNYNLPIIASDIDSFKERIEDGKNGYLFKTNSIDDLRRVLETCIDQNEYEYNNIKDNMKSFVEQEYSQKIIIQKYCNMLDSFIAKNEK